MKLLPLKGLPMKGNEIFEIILRIDVVVFCLLLLLLLLSSFSRV